MNVDEVGRINEPPGGDVYRGLFMHAGLLLLRRRRPESPLAEL